MYVYLLKHVDGKSFKIGKASDIHQRIRALGIGGMQAFDLECSLCVKLPSDDDAYRVEKSLHRLFADWHLEVDEQKRCDGDTEQFAIECFDRVVKFLTDNSDLIAGASPRELPPAVAQASKSESKQLQINQIRAQRRAERAKADVQNALANSKEELKILQKLIGYMNDDSVQCGLWNRPDGDGLLLFTGIRGGGKEHFDFFSHEIYRSRMIEPSGGYGGYSDDSDYDPGIISAYFDGSPGIYSRNTDSGLFIHHIRGDFDKAIRFGIFDLKEKIRKNPYYANAAQKLRTQAEKMNAIVKKIRLIDINDIHSIMKMGGAVPDIASTEAARPLQGIRKVMLDALEGEGFCIDVRSVSHWIYFYFWSELENLGLSDCEIKSSIEAVINSIEVELAETAKAIPT